jgi:hypothetical protein
MYMTLDIMSMFNVSPTTLDCETPRALPGHTSRRGHVGDMKQPICMWDVDVTWEQLEAEAPHRA